MNRQISHFLLALLPLISTAIMAQGARPVIDGPVRNGASFDGFIPNQPFPFPLPLGTGLAGGSIFVIFGSELGPAQMVRGSVPYTDQLPAGPGGTRVSFRSRENDQVYTAYLIHSSRNQVAGIIPSQLPLGRAEAMVTYNGAESEPRFVQIVESSLALFTVSQSGSGPAVIQNYDSPSVQTLNSLTKPARPGQYLILWGTGLGPIEGPDNVPPPVGNLRNDVGIQLNGVSIPAEYAGRSPEFPGVDQINVRLPDDGSIELGCYQEVVLEVGISSLGRNTTVALSDTPGLCDHPWGLSAEDLTKLDGGGTVTFLDAKLSPGFSYVKAARLDSYGVSQNLPQLSVTGAISPWPLSPASCLPITFFRVPAPSNPAGPLRIPPGEAALDIGYSVEFAGPGARTFSLPKSAFDRTAFGPVADLEEGMLVSGEWTLAAAGGADLEAFSSPFSILGLPNLNLPTAVQLGGEMEISWDSAAFREGDRLEISLRPNPEESPQGGVNSLRCSGEALRGSVEITAEQLAWIEAEPGSPLLWEITVESVPESIEAQGLDYGSLTALVSKQIEAAAVE